MLLLSPISFFWVKIEVFRRSIEVFVWTVFFNSLLATILPFTEPKNIERAKNQIYQFEETRLEPTKRGGQYNFFNELTWQKWAKCANVAFQINKRPIDANNTYDVTRAFLCVHDVRLQLWQLLCICFFGCVQQTCCHCQHVLKKIRWKNSTSPITPLQMYNIEKIFQKKWKKIKRKRDFISIFWIKIDNWNDLLILLVSSTTCTQWFVIVFDVCVCVWVCIE